MTTIDVLAEDEVTLPNLALFCKHAFLKASTTDDGMSLRVETEGVRVFISVAKETKHLRYMAVYLLKQPPQEDLQNSLVNELNCNFILARFYIRRTSDLPRSMLMADYFLPFEDGIPTFQIISALRRFSRLVPEAIAATDKHSLVE